MGFRNNFGIWHGLVIPRSKDQTYTTVMGPYNKFQRLKRLYKQSIKLLMRKYGGLGFQFCPYRLDVLPCCQLSVRRVPAQQRYFSRVLRPGCPSWFPP